MGPRWQNEGVPTFSLRARLPSPTQNNKNQGLTGYVFRPEEGKANMNFVVYGMLGMLLVSQALCFALLWSRSPRRIVRAFSDLEDDFEDFKDHVHSVLGRVSRLKRSTLELSNQKEPPETELVSP